MTSASAVDRAARTWRRSPIGALPPAALSPRLAAFAIAVPVACNSLLKLKLTLAIAGWRGGRQATPGSVQLAV